jgi:hypothetical protein
MRRAGLVHHPLAEVKRLEHVAEEGDSPAAILVLILAAIGVAAVILTVVISVSLVVYYHEGRPVAEVRESAQPGAAAPLVMRGIAPG